jgi:hypothetical protein
MKTRIRLIAFFLLLAVISFAEELRPKADTAIPSFDSPDGVTRLLEQRWSLNNIRAFCIPARRHNGMYQCLVPEAPEVWHGRLYPDMQTGFDRITWYATVRGGRVREYELEVYRSDDFWLLEIGTPDIVREPPQVTPDPSADWFIGGSIEHFKRMMKTNTKLRIAIIIGSLAVFVIILMVAERRLEKK